MRSMLQVFCEHEYDDGEICQTCIKCEHQLYRFRDERWTEPYSGLEFVKIHFPVEMKMKEIWISTTVVTNRHYCSILDEYCYQKNDNYPYVIDTLAMAPCWFQKLQDHYSQSQRKFRLPTEEEHIYAACVEEIKDEIELYDWYADNSGNCLQPVKLLLQNKFGLYDMNGNIPQLLGVSEEEAQQNISCLAGCGHHTKDIHNVLSDSYLEIIDSTYDLQVGNTPLFDAAFRVVMTEQVHTVTED